MATLGDLKARIADEIFRDDLTTQIARYIDRAVEFYATKAWWFNVNGKVSGVTAPGVVYATCALVTIDFLVVGTVICDRQSEDTLDEWESQGVTPGQPTDFAFSSDQLRFYLVPNSALPWAASGLKRLALATDAASNEWANEMQDVICAHAKQAICRTISLDAVRAAAAAAELVDALKAVRSLNTRRLSSGKVEGEL